MTVSVRTFCLTTLTIWPAGWERPLFHFRRLPDKVGTISTAVLGACRNTPAFFQTGFCRLARPATRCLMGTKESHTTPNKDNLLIWPFVIFYISPGNHKSGHSACTDAKRGNLGPIVCLARAPMIATPSCSHWFCWHFWCSLPVSKLEKRVELLTHNN